MSGRVRAGLIVPSSNPVIEGFLQRTGAASLLGLDVLVTRVRVRRIAADAGADAQFGPAALAAAAGLLADAEASLIVWAGTSGFWLGGDKEDDVLDQAGRAAGVPVTSSRLAVLAALAERPRARVGVLTPYHPEIHRRVTAAVAASRGPAGPVVADHGLGLERNLDFAAVPDPVIAAALRGLAARGAESLTVICTNVSGLVPGWPPAGPAGAPGTVVDSVLATLWHTARLAGRYDKSYADCCLDVAARLPGPAGAR